MLQGSVGKFFDSYHSHFRIPSGHGKWTWGPGVPLLVPGEILNSPSQDVFESMIFLFQLDLYLCEVPVKGGRRQGL